MREREVEAYLVRRVKALGGFTRKLKWIGTRGAPDRLVCFPAERGLIGGEHYLVELKKPKGGILEAHQMREHRRLFDSGLHVHVAYTKEDVDDLLR